MKKLTCLSFVAISLIIFGCANPSSSTEETDSGSVSGGGYTPTPYYLAYTAITGGYEVSLAGDSGTVDFDIPSTYNGQPVIKIADQGFSLWGYGTVIAGLTIPASVVTIGDEAFKSSTLPSDFAFPTWVEEFGDNAFASATNAVGSSLTLTDVVSIGQYAFYGLDFAALTLPATLTTIGAGAFAYCNSLTGLTIPGGVTSMGYQILGDSDSSSLTAITIAAGVSEISAQAFNSLKNLESVSFETTGALTVGEYAFYNCENLNSLTFEDGVDLIIEELAFGNADFTAIDLSNTDATKIGQKAFYDSYDYSSITSFVLPDTITHLGAYVIRGTNLTVTLNSDVPELFTSTISYQQPFADLTAGDSPIHVPNAYLTNYQTNTAAGWNQYYSSYYTGF